MFTIQNTLEEYSGNKLNSNYDLFCYLKIAQKWNKIMGSTLSRVCAPAFFKNHILTITVLDSAWANELTMKKTNIFRNIQEETRVTVNDLRTRIGEIYNESKEDLCKKEKYITDEDMKWIENVLEKSNIEDEKLNDMFYSMLRNIIKSGYD